MHFTYVIKYISQAFYKEIRLTFFFNHIASRKHTLLVNDVI